MSLPWGAFIGFIVRVLIGQGPRCMACTMLAAPLVTSLDSGANDFALLAPHCPCPPEWLHGTAGAHRRDSGLGVANQGSLKVEYSGLISIND
jgi:hypothetical protein